MPRFGLTAWLHNLASAARHPCGNSTTACAGRRIAACPTRLECCYMKLYPQRAYASAAPALSPNGIEASSLRRNQRAQRDVCETAHRSAFLKERLPGLPRRFSDAMGFTGRPAFMSRSQIHDRLAPARRPGPLSDNTSGYHVPGAAQPHVPMDLRMREINEHAPP